MVLGSFTPYLYSGTLLSHPFGLKNLLTLTLGSRGYFLPESLSSQKITRFTRRSRRCSPINFRDPMWPLPWSSPPPIILVDSYTSLLFIPSFSGALVITRYPEMPRCPGNPCVYCLATSFHTADNSSHLPRIRSSPVDNVILKLPWNTIWSPVNPLQPTAFGDSSYLLALWLIPYV